MRHIRTTKHPSGNLTCEFREEGDTLWKDGKGYLFCNPDAISFYSAVEKWKSALRAQGIPFSYSDMAARL